MGRHVTINMEISAGNKYAYALEFFFFLIAAPISPLKRAFTFRNSSVPLPLAAVSPCFLPLAWA